jgi:hypothetical protein
MVFSCKDRKRKDYQRITKTHALKVRKLRKISEQVKAEVLGVASKQ